MVKVFVGPSHVTPPLLKCGVTMIVCYYGDVPVFVAVTLEYSRCLLLLILCLYHYGRYRSLLLPYWTVAKVTVAVLLPLHTTWLAGWVDFSRRINCLLVKVFCGSVTCHSSITECGVTMSFLLPRMYLVSLL